MKIIILLFFLLFSLQADDTLTELFAELKTISKEDKFKVVNKIKKHIIELKQQERIEAIKILQAKKKAEKEVLVQEIKNETVVEVSSSSTEEAPMMDMPMSSNMESMANMENMSSMSNMNVMSLTDMAQRIRENTREVPSSNMMLEMGGRR